MTELDLLYILKFVKIKSKPAVLVDCLWPAFHHSNAAAVLDGAAAKVAAPYDDVVALMVVDDVQRSAELRPCC